MIKREKIRNHVSFMWYFPTSLSLQAAKELVANNLGDTVTHALAFVYGWGISDTLKLGDLEKPWDQRSWGREILF